MAQSQNEILASARDLAARDEWTLAAQLLRPIAEAAPAMLELWLQIAQWETRDARPKDAQNTLRHALDCNDDLHDDVRALPLWKALAENHYEAQQWTQTRIVCEHILEIAPHPMRGMHSVRDMLATSLAHDGEFEARDCRSAPRLAIVAARPAASYASGFAAASRRQEWRSGARV